MDGKDKTAADSRKAEDRAAADSRKAKDRAAVVNRVKTAVDGRRKTTVDGREGATVDSEQPERLLSASGALLPKNWLSVIVVIWAGQAVSMVTSYAAGYAAIWYVTETTGSAVMLSVMAICAFLPQGLLSPYAGVIADKYNRKVIMIIADGAVGLVSLALGFVILFGDVSLGLIMILVVARSVGMAFHSPAMMASMPQLVPEKHLLRVNSLDQLLLSVSAVGAPALGILLYTTLGFHSVMFLDFFGACAAVFGLSLAKIPTVIDEEACKQHVWANLKDGFRAIASNRGLLWVLAFVTLCSAAVAPLSTLFPLMTAEHFAGNGYMASLTEAAFGVGMIIGAGVLMALGDRRRLALLVAVSMAASGLFTAAQGFMPPTMGGFWGFVVLCVVVAFACAWYSSPLITLLQRNVPEKKLGRAMGLSTSLMTLVSPIGIAAGGALASVFGVATFFVVDGLLCLAFGLLMYTPRSVRKLDE